MDNNQNNFFNRELSWIEFDYRVLQEGLSKDNPLLERLKFISIFSSNLDEFMMVRVAALVSQAKSHYYNKDVSNLSPTEILESLSKSIAELVDMQYRCFNSDIVPKLEQEGIYFYTAKTLPIEYIDQMKELFLNRYFMVLTPMAIDQSRPFPFLSGSSLNILTKIEKEEEEKDPKKEKDENENPNESGEPNKKKRQFAVIPYPSKERFVPIKSYDGKVRYIYVGELIKLFVGSFFKGYNVVDTCIFRITRDSELSINEEGAEDLLITIENELRKRERGLPIRLEVEANSNEELINYLDEMIDYYKGFCFKLDGPLDLSAFSQIAFMSGFEHLKDTPLPPILPIDIPDDSTIFDVIAKKDRLLNLPYESFDPIVTFIREAAKDPRVLAIKQTLYRTSGDSPIIKALKMAAKNGKQVTVILELKARFDEAQNINWAKQLEQSGCHVIYGLVGLKTHAKIALVVRDEDDGIKRYIHLSTGNYNDKTAKIYTDIGIFTCKNSFGADVSDIFNLLTGYSEPPRWKKLVTAPLDLREFFLKKIEDEINNAEKYGKGLIIAKMNSLVDTKIIEALYKASQANVKIKLIVRGMCCLVPQVKGMSENITVISIVDRFLEHSRIYYFYNNGEENIYLSSADWMERNFDRRIETLFPVEDDDLKKVINDILKITLNDNVKARELDSNGKYSPKKDEKTQVRSQIELYNYFLKKNTKKEPDKKKIKFIPIRKKQQ